MAKSRAVPGNGKGVEGERREITKGQQETSKGDGCICYLNVVRDSQVDTYLKTYQIVYIYVQFIVYQLHPNKTVKKDPLNNESVTSLEQLCLTSACCPLWTVDGEMILNLLDYLKYDLMVLIKAKCISNKSIKF